MEDQMLPPKSNPPMPRIPPQSNPPSLDLLYQDLGDEDPTLKMLVPPHLLHASRERDDRWQRTRPNWGLLVCVLFCLAFWASVYWLIWG